MTNVVKTVAKAFKNATPVKKYVAPTTVKLPPSKYVIDTGGMQAKVVDIAKRGVKKAAPKAPTIFFTPEAHEEMRHVVDRCTKEVGWFFSVEELKNGDFVLDKIYIPKQEVTAVETDIDADAMTDMALDLLDKGEDPSKMYAWFHSHVDMGVTPSGQDETQVEEYLDICPIFIRGITNKAGAMKIDVYYPDKGIAFTCVDHYIDYDALTVERKKELEKTLAANVKMVTYAQPTRPYVAPANNLAGGYQSSFYDTNGYGGNVGQGRTEDDDTSFVASGSLYAYGDEDGMEPADYGISDDQVLMMTPIEFQETFGYSMNAWKSENNIQQVT